MTTRPESVATARLKSKSALDIERIELGNGSTPGFPDLVVWHEGEAVPVEVKRVQLSNRGAHIVLTPVQRLWWRNAVKRGKRAFCVISMTKDHSRWALIDAPTMAACGAGSHLPDSLKQFDTADFDLVLGAALIADYQQRLSKPQA